MNYDVLDRVNNCILNNVQYADLFKEIYDLVRDLDKQHLLEMKHLKALNRALKNEIKGQRKDIDDLSKALISIADHRVDSGRHWRVEYNAIVEKARQAIRGL
jgi:predicted phage-related endonuclease